MPAAAINVARSADGIPEVPTGWDLGLPGEVSAPDDDPVAGSGRGSPWFGYASRLPLEVLVVLSDDDAAPVVAVVGAHEAAERRAPVRFIEVLPLTPGREAGAPAQDWLFVVAVRAVKALPRTHIVFESVDGDVGAAVADRSRRASLLVVGGSEPQESSGRPALADQCLRVACCPVRVVPIPQ